MSIFDDYIYNKIFKVVTCEHNGESIDFMENNFFCDQPEDKRSVKTLQFLKPVQWPMAIILFNEI